jgi:hypothetical protein
LAPAASVTPRRRGRDVAPVVEPGGVRALRRADPASPPRIQPAPQPAAEPAREEIVTVSIGRVEVRAAPPPQPAAPAVPAGPRTSLDDWLSQYEHGGGA